MNVQNIDIIKPHVIILSTAITSNIYKSGYIIGNFLCTMLIYCGGNPLTLTVIIVGIKNSFRFGYRRCSRYPGTQFTQSTVVKVGHSFWTTNKQHATQKSFSSK